VENCHTVYFAAAAVLHSAAITFARTRVTIVQVITIDGRNRAKS